MNKSHDVLFSPTKIGKLEIKNRYVMEPIGPGGLCDADGAFNTRGVAFYVERARGGVGLIITGVAMVENEIETCALPSLPCPTLNPYAFVRTGKVVTERVHAYDARMFLQLTAGFGRVGVPGFVAGTPVGPSAIPHRWTPGVVCRELTHVEVKTLRPQVRRIRRRSRESRASTGSRSTPSTRAICSTSSPSPCSTSARTNTAAASRTGCASPPRSSRRSRSAAATDYPVSIRYSIKSFIKDWLQGRTTGRRVRGDGPRHSGRDRGGEDPRARGLRRVQRRRRLLRQLVLEPSADVPGQGPVPAVQRNLEGGGKRPRHHGRADGQPRPRRRSDPIAARQT